MISISEKEFNELKKEKYSFSVSYSISQKEVDPIGMYLTIKGKRKFIFEIDLDKKVGNRYSYIGVNPYKIIKNSKEDITEELINLNEFGEEVKKVIKVKGNIFDYLKDKLDIKFLCLNTDVPFQGGAVGYLAYDTVKLNEKIQDNNLDQLNIPDSYIMFYKYIYCYKHENKQLSIIYNVFKEENESYEQVTKRIYELQYELENIEKPYGIEELESAKDFTSNFSKEQYENIVEKAKQYIRKGDIFQVVLSQRLKFKQRCDAFNVYRKLRKINTSPYLFYIDYEEFQVSGSSPETLVTVNGSTVYTNPIAGTRKRGKDLEEDEKIKNELLKDEKEIAEHVMLVDLGRNDIGKISEFGTVKLDNFMEVNYYSHVMHIVSKVSGKLKGNLKAIDALKACLPVGTVSGAPKVRAMEIIEELENVKRGIYSGAIGYFSFNGNMDSCIAIRSIVFKDGEAFVQAGAGIVYDSIPEMEYYETLNKAMALKEVL